MARSASMIDERITWHGDYESMLRGESISI
jgi:hypothetical protein